MKINKTTIHRGVLLCIAMGALVACQTTQTQAPPDRFAEADVNKDGKLTRDEVGNYLVHILFDACDKNHDGKLTWQEVHVPGVRGQRELFEKIDKNKNGVVTLDEALAYERKHHVLTRDFNKADTNHNGYLTRAEVQAFYGSKEGPPR